MASKILILGGTSEASALARHIAGDERFEPLLSFAGRTQNIPAQPVPHRVGGFGGIQGLRDFLKRSDFAALIDATHPFAAQMSTHAAAAADAIGMPLLRLERAGWEKQEGDKWIDVVDMDAAARALDITPRRVFLTIGRLEVGSFIAAQQHDYLIRVIDDFTPPAGLRSRVIAARGPFTVADERQLLRAENIDIVVSKNSGGDATAAKLVAARELGIAVIMVARPVLPVVVTLDSVDAVMDWLARIHEDASTRRGE
ncbi:MAG TPA: cobalt-precorrin-6A reductase [Parvibaculum sp.]|jgi:precorrin-6A/cobalt-precorrin-6A reductase